MAHSHALGTFITNAIRFQQADRQNYHDCRRYAREDLHALASVMQEDAAIESELTRVTLFAIIDHIADSAR